jgi:hypothetical protein
MSRSEQEQQQPSKQAATVAAGDDAQEASAQNGDGLVEFDERRAKMERLREEGVDP